MLKKFLRKYSPDHKTLHNNKFLKVFGDYLFTSNLWHFNRRSVAWAFAIGLFCAFIPLPCQMLIAAFFALAFHANLPLAIALVWISNPMTMAPIFYFSYKVGTYLLNIPPRPFTFELSTDWLMVQLGSIWQPLLYGSLLCGVVCGLLGYISIRILWRLMVIRAWHARQQKRL